MSAAIPADLSDFIARITARAWGNGRSNNACMEQG